MFRTLIDLSNTMWTMFEFSLDNGIRWGENSFTDYLLYTIKSNHFNDVVFYDFHQVEESITGDDFLLYFLL